MGQAQGQPARSARCIALVGPYLSGKTTLLESILARTGAITRQGSTADGNTVGDASGEARHHGMSVELNAATVDFLGDSFTFLDCPGSIEFQADAVHALTACDAAVVVCEPDEKKVPALQLILKQLEDRGIPHFLFINKIDKAEARVRDVVPMLQPASTKPLVLRQIPIWENDIVTGFIDLALERAYVYREHAPSEVMAIPDALAASEKEARFSMLEKLADYDDELMEQLLEDVPPPRDKVFDDLSKEFREGMICPVFMGSAENGNGIFRLLKALRHEAPFVQVTAKRLGVDKAPSCAFVSKTFHTAHGGKLTLARVLTGSFADGATVYGAAGEERISGIFTVMGQEPTKRGEAKAGDTVAFGRLDSVKTGTALTEEKGKQVAIETAATATPVFGLAIAAKEKKDEVKLTAAIAKIIEEDPSISLTHSQDMGEMVLWGQGEMHLRVALERLVRKYGIDASTRPRQIPYKETIRKTAEVRGRHKKQSGGHGQFGDVVVTIKPRQRGSGFEFSDEITGGVVPKNYIPSVEIGVRDYLHAGPLGFPVVDVAVCLIDGSYHSVDSSDMAFRQAGRIAMSEGMPQCSPVLLEPIMAVEIAVPSEATAKVNSIVSSRRGQILGFDSRAGWTGWDVVEAHIPEAEIQNLIVELRSATAGVGTFHAKFDHLAELTGKAADHVLATRRSKAA
ncbi:MAG TPA: elongation factor G [Methyloceanibacter sp.]|jgi:elongation factor G|nr:elongation factor G [Methyloceanibacter sp.]